MRAAINDCYLYQSYLKGEWSNEHDDKVDEIPSVEEVLPGPKCHKSHHKFHSEYHCKTQTSVVNQRLPPSPVLGHFVVLVVQCLK